MAEPAKKKGGLKIGAAVWVRDAVRRRSPLHLDASPRTWNVRSLARSPLLRNRTSKTQMCSSRPR